MVGWSRSHIDASRRGKTWLVNLDDSSMQADEGRRSWKLLAIKMKARTAVGRWQKSLLSDPGSELCLRRAEEKGKVRR